MLEWLSVPVTTFTNPKGEAIEVKLRYEMADSDSNLFVDSEGMDIDAIAFKYLETEAESLNILQANKVLIVERKFDMAKVTRVRIPI